MASGFVRNASHLKGPRVVREAIAHAFSDAPPVPTERRWVVVGLQLVNLAFASAVISAWTYLAYILAEPIGWATWVPLSRYGNPHLFDYPFMVLWALPIGGVIVAYCARRLMMHRLITTALVLPILTLGIIIGWYYLAPPEWH